MGTGGSIAARTRMFVHYSAAAVVVNECENHCRVDVQLDGDSTAWSIELGIDGRIDDRPDDLENDISMQLNNDANRSMYQKLRWIYHSHLSMTYLGIIHILRKPIFGHFEPFSPLSNYVIKFVNF